MANYVLKIVTDQDKFRERCEETNLSAPGQAERITKIVNELKETLRANKNLVALCAPQIGYQDRVFVMRFANGDIRAFINAMILTRSKSVHLSRETSASIPNKEFIVPRNDDIEVAYQVPTTQPQQNKFSGAPAEVFQQMVDMTDGVLLSDIGLEILEGFDELSEDERTEILSMYLDSLQNTSEILKEEINNNKDLKELDNAINFLSKVYTGEVKIEDNTPEEYEQLKESIKKSKGIKE